MARLRLRTRFEKTTCSTHRRYHAEMLARLVRPEVFDAVEETYRIFADIERAEEAEMTAEQIARKREIDALERRLAELRGEAALIAETRDKLMAS